MDSTADVIGTETKEKPIAELPHFSIILRVNTVDENDGIKIEGGTQGLEPEDPVSKVFTAVKVGIVLNVLSCC